MPEVLETIQTDRGCVLTQIERRGPFAIFHRTKDDRCRGYELVHIRYREEIKAPGGIIPAGEKYPGVSTWGKDAITITSLPEALDRLGKSVPLGKVATAARLAPSRIIKPVKNPRKKK